MALCTSSTGSPKKPMSVHASPTPVMRMARDFATVPGTPVEFAQDILRKANCRWLGHLPAPPAAPPKLQDRTSH